MRGFHYLENVATLRHDEAACNGCAVCVEVCPHQVFALAEGEVRVIARDACIECGACALNCELGAITVDSGVGCASGIYAEWWREVTKSRRPSAGCC